MRVLLIEDEPDIQKVIQLSLTLMGSYEVMMAENCSEGVEAAMEKGPDLILLDVMLPETNGYETFHILRQDERTRSIPVIFISAKTQPSEIEYGLKLGAIGYITKPFDPIQLPEQIRIIVEDFTRPRPTPSGTGMPNGNGRRVAPRIRNV